MRSIVIGDVHGCYYSLMRLLDKVKYDPRSDHLYFLGDLVGKGLHSAKVMDLMLTFNNVSVTLGNNDLFWMYHHTIQDWGRPDFTEMEQYDTRDQWYAFLKKQEFLIEKDFAVLVHASVHPSWTISDALRINDELITQLRNNDEIFLKSLEADPLDYESASSEEERWKTNAYILTECRYYHGKSFDLKSYGPPEEIKADPWYQLPRKIKKPIAFGHWASLKGRKLLGVVSLDGACVYGGKLMAMVGETEEIFTVDRDKDDSKEET